ncbi:MAG: decaprenyl-phosphate phosphoribosyltransferase [Candidatus Helarchaeota archaeon]
MKMLRSIWQELRPRQWIKNFVVFAGLIYSQNLFNINLALKSLWGFLLFCSVASAAYIINDILDLELDRQNVFKKQRPIASGYISIRLGIIIASFLFLLSILGAQQINFDFFLIILSYFILIFLYSVYLKKIIILDILVIASGFVLRAVGGAVIINVVISPWLIVCTILVSLFLVLGKRRYEIVNLSYQQSPNIYSKDLTRGYNLPFIDQLIAIIAASTIIAYVFYTISDSTIKKFGSYKLAFTTPIVIYGIFRYLYLIYKEDKGGAPEALILSDLPLLLTIGIWLFLSIILIYY